MTDVTLDIQALRAAQLDLGLTDEEFAKQMGISLRTLHNWRSGEIKPAWGKIVRVARKLDIEPVTLIIRDEVPA